MPGRGQGLPELGFQMSEWSCLGFQQGFTRLCVCWWKPSPSPGGPAGLFAGRLHPWSRDGGKEQTWGPLFQEIPFQSPGVQCQSPLVFVLSLHSSLQLLVPAKGRSPLQRGGKGLFSSSCTFPRRTDGPNSQHYLLLWHQEPPAEVTIRGISWEQPNQARPAGTGW